LSVTVSLLLISTPSIMALFFISNPSSSIDASMGGVEPIGINAVFSMLHSSPDKQSEI
jgi:hypothetical protein